MQINKLAMYVAIYVHISIARLALGLALIPRTKETRPALGLALISMTEETRTAELESEFLLLAYCMLEIASYKYNYWQVNRACQIRSVHHDRWGTVDVFGKGGTNFGCQNQSGEPNSVRAS